MAVQLQTMVGATFGPAGQNHAQGLVPDPGSTAHVLPLFLGDDGAFHPINVFNGVGDGVTDNTAAMNAALAALSGNGGVIFFPPGKFRFNSAISFTLPNRLFSLTIVGSGQDVTILYWPNGSGGLTINYGTGAYQSTAHVWDLSITTGQANGGTGLTFVGNALTIGTSDIYRVTFRGDDGYNISDYWTIGIAANFVSDLNLEGVMVIGQATLSGAASTNLHGVGLSIVGNTGGSQYAVQINVAKSNFLGLSAGILFGSFVQGLTVDQCNFTGVGNGITAPGSETGTLAQLSVTNSQFGLYNTGGTNAIFASTAIDNVTIANNFFFVNSTASSANGVNLTNNFHFNIYGNQFASESTSSGSIAIYANTTSAGGAGVIANNDIFAWAFGIDLDTGSSGIIVTGNTLEANTTAIANAGTSNVIVNNPGYNPVGVSVPVVGTSPWTYTAGSSPETLYYRSSNTGFTSITLGGQSAFVGLSTGQTITIELGPGESMVVTDTSATRVLVRSIH